ncbi:MAG: heavy-metal-associated domain-containing protein [Bowdeniella nasicola]|nr:heavy-metal-associated domain-containing protein [Bowdeniella nasicola]
MSSFDRTVVLKVEGMTCGHCVAHVSDELSEIPQVDNVVVTLVKDGTSTVTVYISAPVDDDALRAAIDEAGDYTVRAIERDF